MFPLDLFISRPLSGSRHEFRTARPAIIVAAALPDRQNPALGV